MCGQGTKALQLGEQVGDLVSKGRALTFHQETSVSGKGKTAGQLYAVMTPLGAEYCYLTGALSDTATLVFCAERSFDSANDGSP